MKLQQALTVRSGEISAHLFENLAAGVPLRLDWYIAVDFDDVRIEGEQRSCGLLVEDLSFPVSAWSEIDGKTHRELARPRDVRCYFTLLGHHEARLKSLTFERATADAADTRMQVTVAVTGIPEFKSLFAHRIEVQVKLRFEGVSLRPDNVRCNSAAEASALVARFLSLDCLMGPVWVDERYLFKPKKL